MTPPFWRDDRGKLRPVYPSSRCGRDAPIYDDVRLVDLKRLGWSLFTPATYMNWCGRLGVSADSPPAVRWASAKGGETCVA